MWKPPSYWSKVSPQQPASYIIYKDDLGYVCAKNGETGKIDFRNTDAATVIQNAIDALTNGGKVLIKEGIYSISTQINLKPKVSIIGSGINKTILKAEAGATYDAIFGMDSYTRNDVINVEIAYMSLDGEGSSVKYGLYPRTGRSFYHHLHIHHFADTGIVMTSVTQSAEDYIFPENYIYNCFIHNHPNYGINLFSGDSYVTNVITHYNSKMGIRIGGAYNFLAFCHSFSEGENATGFGIYGNGTTLVACEAETGAAQLKTGFYIAAQYGVRLIGCKVFSAQYGVAFANCEEAQIIGLHTRDITSNAIHIWTGNTVTTLVIQGCVFRGTAGSDLRKDGDITNLFLIGNSMPKGIAGAGTITNLYAIKNRGYITENSGVATFSGDGSTTDFEIGVHGLAVTDPDKIVVKVTPISSDAIAASPCIGYVDPADNTKIRVKFASAPASGTDNVKIIWKAEVC